MCPHEYSFLHPAYRKLCHLLADIDEWGQIITLNVLTRYCRYTHDIIIVYHMETIYPCVMYVYMYTH